MEVALLRQGDAWRVGIARNPVFSRTKWFPAAMCSSRSGASYTKKLNSEVQIALYWLLSMFVFAVLADTVLLWVARRWSQLAVELLLWRLGIERNLVFFAQSLSWRWCGEPCLCDGCGSRSGASYTVSWVQVQSGSEGAIVCTVRTTYRIRANWMPLEPILCKVKFFFHCVWGSLGWLVAYFHLPSITQYMYILYICIIYIVYIQWYYYITFSLYIYTYHYIVIYNIMYIYRIHNIILCYVILFK